MLAFGAVEYLKRTLPTGVRILVSEMPETRSASLAVFVWPSNGDFANAGGPRMAQQQAAARSSD